MSGPFREWVEGSKVTEKHLSGLVRGLADTVVEGLVVSDGGGVTIDISGGKALITGYENRYDAVSGFSIGANKVAHVWAAGNDTFAYQIYTPAGETYPPVAPGTSPGYLLIGIVETGASSVSWVWNNPLVRGHIDEPAFRAGRGMPDKAFLLGEPRIEMDATSISGGVENTVISWPPSGTKRGRIDFVTFSRWHRDDEFKILVDGETSPLWHRKIDVWDNTAFPFLTTDFYLPSYYGEVGKWNRRYNSALAWHREEFWTRGQFEQGFVIKITNGDASLHTYQTKVYFEILNQDDIEGR